MPTKTKVAVTPSRVEVWEHPPDLLSKQNHNKSHIWVERTNFYCVDTQKKRKGSKTNSNEPYLLIGFDTEFKTPELPVTRDEITAGNAKYEVLSYQFHCRLHDGVEWTGICCPDSGQRLSFGEFLIFALGKGVRDGVVKVLPTRIFLIGHFTRADVPAFGDFKDLTGTLMNVRNTFISENGYIALDIAFPTDNCHVKGKEEEGAVNENIRLKVTLRDTMLLSPQNSKSLAEIGKLVGQPKIKLDDDPLKELYLKRNMDVVRRDDWELFKRYAMNDASICVKYAQRVIDLSNSLTGCAGGHLPITLTSMGVELLDTIWRERLQVDRLALIGKEAHVESRWDKKKGYFVKRTLEVDMEEVHWHTTFVTECYHGGRNEQFWFGPGLVDDWFDYDLSSAYPTAMSLIGEPDWKAVFNTNNIDDFKPSGLGFAFVDFEFPQSVRFPVLPVRTDNGLVFPRTGTSYCCSPELTAAVDLGAHITIRRGCIVPCDYNKPVFGHFIKHCLDERQKHPKGSLNNLFWKELANSTYGKTAQGLRERRVYDMRDRSTKPLPPSKITNPFFAAFITSFVRAVLGEITNKLPKRSTVFSCTTDGFLTNATKAQIAKASSGTLAKVYRDARFKLVKKSEVLEIKHHIRQPLGWRTRGQATLKPGPKSASKECGTILLAKSGIYTASELETDKQKNDYIVNLFFNRKPDDTVHVTTLTGIRDIVEWDADLVAKQLDKRLNMEFDWKRRPTHVCESDVKGHLAFDTEPWDTIEQFRSVRQLWTTFSLRQPICIKTLADFGHFANYCETFSLIEPSNGKYLRTAGGVAPDLARLRQSICAAWQHRECGFQDSDWKSLYAEGFAKVLVGAGIPCKKSDVQNAFKKKFKRCRVPRTTTCAEAFEQLKLKFPALDDGALFADGGQLIRLRP